MADVIKFIGSQLVLTTANNIATAPLVLLSNLDGANSANVTQAYANGTTKAVFTLGHHGTGFGSYVVVKDPTDTLAIQQTGGPVRAVPVAYR